MRKYPILVLSATLLLSGCSQGYITNIQNSDDKTFSFGKNTYTAGELYQMLKKSVGSSTAITELQKLVYDAEIPVTDEIRQEAQTEFETMAAETEDIEALLAESGYTQETYIENIVIPNIQSDKLMQKYYKDNAESIKSEYKPSVAVILQCDDEKTAQKALDALKSGTEQADVFAQYQSQVAAFSDDEVLITTKDATVPTRLVNTLYKQKEPGLVKEVFTDDSGSSAFVAILVNNNYDEIQEQLTSSLSTDTDFATETVQFYLKKHNFEIHDQEIFNEFKANYPQFLVNHPELMNQE